MQSMHDTAPANRIQKPHMQTNFEESGDPPEDNNTSLKCFVNIIMAAVDFHLFLYDKVFFKLCMGYRWQNKLSKGILVFEIQKHSALTWRRTSVSFTRFTANVAIPRSATPPTPRTSRVLDSRRLKTTATASSPILWVLWNFIAPFRYFVTSLGRKNELIPEGRKEHKVNQAEEN